MNLTYSHLQNQYSISISRNDRPWTSAKLFHIRFEGAYPKVISTDRHQMSDGNQTVTARDTGFGNVLDGLAKNQTAIASLDGDQIEIMLAGAEASILELRRCAAATQI